MLNTKFEMTNLGLLHYCLGIEVWKGPKSIFISQQKYATEILKVCGMMGCKSIGTPTQIKLKLSKEDSNPVVDSMKYRKLVRSLIFLCITRPNISYAAGLLSKFSNKPKESLLEI